MWKKTMCKLLTVVITCTLVSSKTSVISADEVQKPNLASYEDTSGRLLPLARNIKGRDGTLQISKNVNLLGKDSADKDSIRVLLEFFKENNIVVNEVFNEDSTTIALGEEGALSSEVQNLEKNLNIKSIKDLKEEGYVLSITSEPNDISNGGSIFLKGKDGDGTFYAVKTLIQLAENNNNLLSFNNVLITDEPSMSTRGIVEGFYGTPWNQSKRLDQIRFYGDYKMNTYIYAPKDDQYHREKWRIPYPESEMGRMKELINTAKENKVDFVFAISPGIDIKFDGQAGENDFMSLIAKCESLYDMGVRSFAILFDDISNKEGDKQARLLNRFNKDFIKAKSDVKPLITVPTEYDTRAMGIIGDLSSYTQGFSGNLDKDIKVMWTGQSIVSESLPIENAEFMRAVYGDNVGIWWNYPVTDYLKSKLALGPIVNIDKEIEGKIDFFTMNPMEHANLSKISLATGADYAWNISEYDYDKSWNRSIELLFKELSSEMKTFANHSSRMDGSWGIGRNDAEEIRSTMNDLWLKVSKNQDITDEINMLNTEFDNMIKASDTLKVELPQEILNECLGNLNKLKLLGSNGKVALELILAQINKENDEYNQLKNQLTSALSLLNSGSKVSDKTVLSFIKEAIDYDPMPSSSFNVSKTFVAPGEEIELINTSSISTQIFEWTFEGAKVEKTLEQNPKVVYENEGIYTIKLVGKNSLGESEVIKEDLITVSNLAKRNTENLALNKKVTASSYVNINEAPQFAVDGSTRTKWCATAYGNHTLNIDLGEISLVNEIIISHAEAGGEPAAGNTLAYKVEISEDGTNFRELVRVTNNEKGLTKDQVPVTKGRYVRLVIDKPTQGTDRAARIYEVEVMGLKGDVELPPKYEKPLLEVDKTLLGIFIDYAKDVKKNGALENVIPAVVKEFEVALKEAEEVFLGKNTTEVQVELASQRLAKVIHMLEFKKGNKKELGELIKGINILDKDKYKAETWDKLQSELEKANKVMKDENAMEAEVIEAYNKLIKSYLDLRLIPDKSKLEELLNKAEEIDLSKYTKASVEKFNIQLANVKEVLDNEEATEKEVEEAQKSLELVMDNLEEIAQAGTDSESANNSNTSNTDNSGKSNNSTNNENTNNNNNTGKGSSNGKLPSTGGTSSVAVGAIALLITAVGVVLRKRK